MLIVITLLPIPHSLHCCHAETVLASCKNTQPPAVESLNFLEGLGPGVFKQVLQVVLMPWRRRAAYFLGELQVRVTEPGMMA